MAHLCAFFRLSHKIYKRLLANLRLAERYVLLVKICTNRPLRE